MIHHDSFDCLGAAVLLDLADQGGSISTEEYTSIKTDSSGAVNPHQPDCPMKHPANLIPAWLKTMIPVASKWFRINRPRMFKAVSGSSRSYCSFSFVPMRLNPTGAFSLPSTRYTSQRASESPASSRATSRSAQADSRTIAKVVPHSSDRFPVNRASGFISQ